MFSYPFLLQSISVLVGQKEPFYGTILIAIHVYYPRIVALNESHTLVTQVLSRISAYILQHPGDMDASVGYILNDSFGS